MGSEGAWLFGLLLMATLSMLLLRRQVVEHPCNVGAQDGRQVYRRRCGRYYVHQDS